MSDNVNFADYIESERERLTAKQREITEYQKVFNDDCHRQLANLGRELAAIAAYEAAKTGKATARGGNANAPRSTRARRGSRREEIATLLSLSPAGITRDKMLIDLGVKGDKSAEMSVSNALSGMHRAGQVVRLDGGRWAAATNDGLQAAAE